ncbi:unnamed protein product [Arabidopsis arenosa]|uniref:Uncharacterized protein n=1 Tax=Arabidopsis arenosa TaxID=38785 RepID=A0A8S2ASR8_ARAAE|nr:unnamed protein product [Arabidopsis arenosa]
MDDILRKKKMKKEKVSTVFVGDARLVEEPNYKGFHGNNTRDSSLDIRRLKEDQETAVRLANTMKNSLKGRPVQAPIFEGKVPPQFCCTFQHMVVLKVNQTESVALIQVSGTRVHNNKALQVEAIWKMDLEARSLQPSAKAVSADQRGRLAMSVKRLDQSKDRVREIRRLMLETEEVGISVFQDLNQQCQTLLHVHTKVVKIDGRVIGDGKVGRVTRTLQNAYKKDRGFWCPMPTYQEP